MTSKAPKVYHLGRELQVLPIRDSVLPLSQKAGRTGRTLRASVFLAPDWLEST